MALCVRSSPAQWARATFGSVELGDPRREARLLHLAECLMNRPNESLPGQLGELKSLKAAYRLLDNEEVSFEALSEPHWQQTRERAGDAPLVLMIQDTTKIDHTHHPQTTGLGPIGDGRGRGYLLHTTLAVIPEPRRLIGIAHQIPFLRRPAPEGETSSRQRVGRERESRVWAQAAAAVGTPPEGSRWVHVGDRGSDIFGFMGACLEQGCDFLLRAAQNRRLATDDTAAKHLISTARSLEAADHREIEVPRQHGRPRRRTTVAMGYQAISINAPYHTPHQDPINAWVIRVWEVDPAPDVDEALEWILVTTVPTEDVAAAWQRVDWYHHRWISEDYHRCLKTGCRIEDRHLGTYDRLQRLLGVLAPVAANLLQLRDVAKTEPDRLAREQLPADLVNLVATLAGLSPATLTLDQFWQSVAKQGGYLGRRSDGPPGWQTIWRGWSHILVLLDGVRLASRLPPETCG